MRANKFDHKTIGTVRRYSEQVLESMPGSPLAQGLDALESAWKDEENKPEMWRKWLRFDQPESDPDTRSLQGQAKELAGLWLQLKLDAGDIGGLSEDGIPSLSTLWKVAHDAESEWAKKRDKGFGKAKARLFTFLDTMDAHKYLFSIIPNGDKYTSLLTGSLTSIVKASANHEKTAEGISLALEDISKDLNYVGRSTEICDTPELRRHIIVMYCEVFEFLCHTIKWYSSSWNRFRKAYDGKFYDKLVQQRVQKIQRLVQRVRDELKLSTGRSVNIIRVEQQRGFLEMSSRFDSLEDTIDEKIEEKLQAFAIDVGYSLRDLAPKIALQLMAHSQHEMTSPGRLMVHTLESTLSTIPDQVEIRSQPTLNQLVQLLSPYGDNGKADLSQDPALDDQMVIPGEVVTDIQRWITSPGSSLLWVEGPAYGEFAGALSSIGLRISNAAKGLDLPCIAFFAKMRYTFQKQGFSRHDAGFVAMLYSLISQLAAVVPTTVDIDFELTGRDFEKLDGTCQSIPHALKILEVLLSIDLRGLVCVVSGFDLIDCREHLQPLMQMIRCLQTQPAEKRVKTLFITQGNCLSLSRTTDFTERSDASRMVLARSSVLLAGGTTADNMRLS